MGNGAAGRCGVDFQPQYQYFQPSPPPSPGRSSRDPWSLDFECVRGELSDENLLQRSGQQKQVCRVGEIQLSVGWSCVKGYKPNNPVLPNQDDFLIARIGEDAVYAVFDGHGDLGHVISHATKMFFSRVLHDRAHLWRQGWRHGKEYVVKLMDQLFRECQEYLVTAYPMETEWSGTTATVIIHYRAPKILCVAHVGDSRAVLLNPRRTPAAAHPYVGYMFGGMPLQPWEAQELTADHNPSNPNERRRIHHEGGMVTLDGERLAIHPPSQPTHCSSGSMLGTLFPRCQSFVGSPTLSLSRSLGDTNMQSKGLSYRPDVALVNCMEGSMLVVCTDGVWTHIRTPEAAELVAAYSSLQGIQDASNNIVGVAWERWRMNPYVDDITSIVAYIT
ncbi:unnamed protein product [Vitrella brassicaformis CCMP3155]|uniref:PPM-type phosphatase domain-containing protein n=2 Tax=Vitrella brassicaformis TaxID=1169539 RepID=A0A0G4ECI5_VITBC|nr:unnamed protein product [Vitrella brassicaformis CCMP3155]|mmetsp:Transcript_39065/g.97791  ORF Transcript_39065/g.97791 Transcript_39065/m.97791 type:complete len:389 (+) Transcript_39065:18-1184(+)|eukprot:CEL93254.1 unnamed protein product [Vitrella brassicaformis CCMP3155]